MLAAHGEYRLEQKVYDDTDTCYVSDGVSVINDDTVPSTRQYHYGFGVKLSGVHLAVQSTNSECMTVDRC